jgi:hypothetical protein
VPILRRLAQLQRAGGVDDALVVGQEGQAHRLRTRGDDALAELHDLRLAGLALALARGLLDGDVVRPDEGAIAAHDRDLAHLGHGREAARELAHDLVLVREQLAQVDLGHAVADAEVGEVADLVHHRGHVQQGLARDAAHVQADPAERGVALDKDDLHPQVGRAEGSRVAARAGAEHEQVALEVGGAGVGGGSDRRSDGSRGHSCAHPLGRCSIRSP